MALPSSANSGELQNYLRLADIALRAGDQANAMLVAENASAKGLDHPNLLALAVFHALANGEPIKAMGYAERARKLAPNNPDVMQAVAMALANNDRQKSLAVYEKALRQQPSIVPLRYNRARLLEDMGDAERARRDYERVVELAPNHSSALARLAAIAVANNEADAARKFADRALKLNPRETAAVIVLAQADLLEKKYDAVIAQMSPLAANEPGAVNRSLAQGLIADSLDAQDKKKDAFAAYKSSNNILKAEFAPRFAASDVETALARAERTLNYVNAAQTLIAAAPQKSPVKTHIFLLGFPRSGTTLLENVLAGHPDIETVEERDGLLSAEMDFVVPPDGLAKFDAATDFAKYRDAYWAEMEEAGASLDKPVFIDKMPLNSLLLPLVAKLFPDAKVLLAIRDPRDVILSCFRRRFGMSAKMYELLSLDRAAAFYDVAMRLCAAAQVKYPMPFRVTRYEDLVGDFEKEARSICAFLGVEYTDTMAGFADRAQGKLINTPSAAQVAQGLYTRGVDQWRAYKDQLVPVLPTLAPWIKKFGYAEE